MTAPAGLGERLDALCRDALEAGRGTPAEARVEAIRERLHGPLRVAIAGRIKTGKSTLLNALVGERLAPTDAGECTKIVTWYRHGPTYDVRADLRGGGSAPLTFRRDGGTLEIALPAEDLAIERLEVTWPSQRLVETLLIDTPGLGSVDEESVDRTLKLFGADDEAPPTADAVLYLMRHVHRGDADFLEAFRGQAGGSSPVNAIGVLSRADEVGSGRPDALDSAAAISARNAEDPRLRPLVSTVIPIAGLLAETGTTFQEHEAAALRAFASEDESLRESMLLSADRFCAPESSALTAEVRRELLDRLGIFGVRLTLGWIAESGAVTASDLSRRLVEASGLTALRDLLSRQFAVRAQRLMAHSALLSLRAVATELSAAGEPGGAALAAQVEAVESSAHELAELDLLHLAFTGEGRFSPAEAREIEQLTAEGTPGERLGMGAEADPEALRAIALASVARWRERAANPLTDRETGRACEIASRSYEGIYAALI